MPAAERAAYANGYEAGLHSRLVENEKLKYKIEQLEAEIKQLKDLVNRYRTMHQWEI
jgi:hypothetical protein